MEFKKGPRHNEIIGECGKHILLNWLSRSGVEGCMVDHPGLDVIAYHPAMKQRLGITVKSRTRTAGAENSSVNLMSYSKGKDDRQKLLDACKAFSCEPYLAIYIETSDSSDLFLTSLENYDKKYRSKEWKTLDDWKMGETFFLQYDNDDEVRHVHMIFDRNNWE